MCCCSLNKEAEAEAASIGRPLLDPKDITDITSTGRKRAAALYPIMEGMLCEWAELASAGGGVQPIVGCRGNTISATKHGANAGHRHHGPNKNTIDNGPLNVHRICTWCHNRWHALNNKYYVKPRPPAEQPWLPVPPEGQSLVEHDRTTKATEEEYEASDAYWGKQDLNDIDTND